MITNHQAADDVLRMSAQQLYIIGDVILFTGGPDDPDLSGKQAAAVIALVVALVVLVVFFTP